MRLFLAISIPQAVRRELVSFCTELSQQLPVARWTPSDRMHLTVVFLGEVESDGLEELEAGLSGVSTRHRAFQLAISNTGTFPPRRPARVAWVGLEHSHRLVAFQRDLRAATETALERRLDRRPYSAHLTMARCRKPWPRHAVDSWVCSTPPCVGTSFEVTYFDLMQSRLTPSGPRYTKVQRFPLEA